MALPTCRRLWGTTTVVSGVVPRNPAYTHRAVLHEEGELDLFLGEQHVRKVTRNLSVSLEGALNW